MGVYARVTGWAARRERPDGAGRVGVGAQPSLRLGSQQPLQADHSLRAPMQPPPSERIAHAYMSRWLLVILVTTALRAR